MPTNSALLKKVQSFLFFTLILLLPTQLGIFNFTRDAFINGVRVDYLATKLYFTDIVLILLIGSYCKVIARLFIDNIKSIAIVLFLVLINIILSDRTWIGLYTLIKYLEIVLLGIIVYSKRSSLDQLIIPLTIGVFLELLLSIFQITQHGSIQGVFYWLGERYLSTELPGIAKTAINGVAVLRPYGTFSHPNSMGGFYILLYALFLFYPQKQRTTLLTFYYYGFLLFSSLLVFITFSRTVIAIHVLISIVYVLFVGKTDCRLCKFGRVIGLLSLGLFFASQPHGIGSITQRSDLIQNGVVLFLQHPLFGVGLGQHLYGLAKFSTTSSYFFNQPIHNVFLIALVEWGVVVFGLVLFQLFNWVKKHQTNLVYAALGVIIITGLTDHFWITLQQNMLLLGVVGGLLYTKTNSPKKE